MIDNVYKNAFKEVYEILQNTEEELVKKIPQKFVEFLQSNMNKDYQINIDNTIEIDKQSILPETEAILALIYRSYWATDEEKLEFANMDKQEQMKQEFQGKSIDEIFEQRKNINNITIDNNLMVIEEESFIKTIFKKILKFFKF